MNLIQKMKDCFDKNMVYYTKHAKTEMENEEFGRIYEHEVYEAICNGEIIEEYLESKPYPGFLIFGRTEANRPLHIVCAYNSEEDITIIITVYHPDPNLWIDYRRRRKRL
jgi:hypothetical protein